MAVKKKKKIYTHTDTQCTHINGKRHKLAVRTIHQEILNLERNPFYSCEHTHDDNNSCVLRDIANGERRTAQFAICAYLLLNFFFSSSQSRRERKKKMMDHVVRDPLNFQLIIIERHVVNSCHHIVNGPAVSVEPWKFRIRTFPSFPSCCPAFCFSCWVKLNEPFTNY